MTQTLMQFDAKPKLSRQQALILEFFKTHGGRATNVELADICLRYGGRLHELRQKGYDIQMIERGSRGVRTYELKRDKAGRLF